jgi:predicted MPP superfamily phosphohydrolase
VDVFDAQAFADGGHGVSRPERQLGENRTNQLKPDVILISGDVFDDHNSYSYENAKLFNNFNAPVFMSSGNHEGYVGFDNVSKMLKPTSVRWLTNQVAQFKGIQIIGINNSYHYEYLDVVLHELMEKGKFTILMYHQPVGFETAATAGVNLMLCGHTHSGQIWPFSYVVRQFYPRLTGMFHQGDSRMIVGPGTGTWGPRMRLGSRSEIAVIDLKLN